MAAAGLWQTAKSNRRTETFQHLRDVNITLAKISGVKDMDALRDDLLAYTRRNTNEFSDDASNYKTFLDTLELLAFAIDNRAVDRRIALTYLRTLVGGYTVPRDFLVCYREALQDKHSYEYLLRLIDSRGATLPR